MGTPEPRWARDKRVLDLAAAQHGVLSRMQGLVCGLSTSAIGRRVAAGAWVTVHPGVYLLNGRPATPLARLWAAWLYAESPSRHPSSAGMTDPTAVVSGEAALWLAGVVDDCPAVVEIATKARQVRRQRGLRVVRLHDLRAHPALMPPRMHLDDALLAVVNRASSSARVVDLVLAAGQRRLTTPDRIAAAVGRRTRLRWRSLVLQLCADLDVGVQTPLERHYERQVERRHGLPRGERNRRDDGPSGSAWYRDVRYRAQGCLVELDGRAAHPVDEAFRDRRRDNHGARQGETTLRYGWREVVAQPCAVAAEVALVLRRAGWGGGVRPCGPGCPVGDVPQWGRRPA